MLSTHSKISFGTAFTERIFTNHEMAENQGFNRGFIKGRAPGKLTGGERDVAINLPGCFHLLFLLSFIRKTKNARLKNSTDLMEKNLTKPLF